jgi:hypothetical protein
MSDLGPLCAPERTWKTIRSGHRGLSITDVKVPVTKATSVAKPCTGSRRLLLTQHSSDLLR